MAPMAPAERICISCEKEDGKYKCTKCAKYTCSLPCSKAHREIHDKEPQPADTSSSGQAAAGVAAADENEPEGGHSPLTKLFKKYPNLPHQLRAIADSTDPPKDESGNRLNFNPRRKKEVWTQEIGLQNGMNALRKGLSAPRGADSEGLREYCELFKHQLAEKAEQGEDPDAELRRRAAQHDAEVIRKLMEEDKKQNKD